MLGKLEEYEKPFVEKYRPKYLEDVVGNSVAVEQLKAIAEQGNLPNILIVGPPGTGKTTSVLCLARQMLKDTLKEAVLELNASDERGIDVVRDKIKSFAHQKVTVPENMHKIVILDEADSMTESAQQALRMIMTEYSETTRFALACNDSSKIIEPIQSRCAIVRFTKLGDDEILERLNFVIDEETIDCDDSGLKALLFTAEGDMRYALNNLQATVAGFGEVRKDNVYKVCDQPHPELMERVVNHCLEGEFEEACEEIDTVFNEGYNILDIIGTLNKIIQTIDMNDERRLGFLKHATDFKMRVLEGNDSQLQLHAFLASLWITR
jgi:replication factor C subunit 2/4